ncbi:hypothetical protein, partial [Saccharothrix sp. ST-888]|uniref:hypothetical protein n=1 Tax=Saccharothrix sp. ST-888 TaxID=1427391 RepID=UPI001E5D22F5
MPPDVMGKGVPLADLFNEKHPRYNEGTEIRPLYQNDPDVKKIIDTGVRIAGLLRPPGLHAAPLILPSTPPHAPIPLHPELEAPLSEVLGPTYGLIVY